MDNLEIVGCYSCPMAFRGSDGVWICGHPGVPTSGQLRLPTNKYGVIANIPHDDCRLKKEPITLSLQTTKP